MRENSIDKMEAGRETDALVAERMGKDLRIYDCPHKSPFAFCVCPDLPRYSTDRAAMWEVLDALQYNWSLSRDVGQCGDDYETSGDRAYRFIYSAPGMPMEGIVAPTAPLAICRAVVKAGQVKIEG